MVFCGRGWMDYRGVGEAGWIIVGSWASILLQWADMWFYFSRVHVSLQCALRQGDGVRARVISRVPAG